jgi:adenine-specific DNA-methyltransferase
MLSQTAADLLKQFSNLNAPQLRRLLVEQLTKQKLGLYWESNAIERDAALNANVVLPRLIPEFSHTPEGTHFHQNLIIEGDNFDSLRLLRATHAGKIRVIYIDPPYNTGNKDWVYNDKFVGANDRWRHSQWLEFLYQRLTLARELLTSDGVILVSINDENRSRLELLMDEVFPQRRLGSLVWRTRDTTNAKDGNFSDVHEHVLIYAGQGFSFRGREKLPTKYKNPDNDPDGPWNGDPLTLAFDRQDRPNLYYPLHNPKSDVWYPCDESRVWAYATEKRVADTTTLRAETMEEFVRLGRILFPDMEKRPEKATAKQIQNREQSSRTLVWNSMSELLEAIDSGDVPVTPKRQRPLLTRQTPNLEFWVGKKICFGRPLFKKHWKFLKSHVNPLGSWIARLGENDDDDVLTLRSPQAGEGTEAIQEVFGSKVFQYPKPPLLIRELLSQATGDNDIVLDFFAGSGTTGQAVLELNAEDGGNRRFIMCSSTEATAKEPDKNLCRDVCAERLRRVMTGYSGKTGYSVAQGGEFAYLQLDKVEAADVAFEATAVHANTLISLRETASAGIFIASTAIQIIAKGSDWLTVLCPKVTPQTLDELAELPATHGVARLAVFCPRPKALALLLAERGVEANTYSITDALLKGQVSSKKGAKPATPDTQSPETTLADGNQGAAA